MFVHRAAEGTTSRLPLELTLKLSARFHQPAIPERQQQDWVDLGIEQRLAGGHAGQESRSAAENGNWLLVVDYLRLPTARSEKLKKKYPYHPRQQGPPAACKMRFLILVMQLQPHVQLGRLSLSDERRGM